MPIYYVKSATYSGDQGPQSRVIAIEADYYVTSEHGDYEFIKRGVGSQDNRTVATVQGRDVFAVFEEGARRSEFLEDLAVEDVEDSDDVCLDCRFSELLESEEFFDAVCKAYDVIQQADAESEELPTIHKRKYRGDEYWGFLNDDGNFVPFFSRLDAEDGWKVRPELKTRWSTLPIHETELVKETVQ
jgi:hypothetical protein